MTITGPIFGYAEKFYYNAGSYGSPTWTEITTASKLKLNLTFDEQVVSNRAGGGFKLTEPTLLVVEYAWEQIWDPQDAPLMAFLTAFLDRGAIELLALDAAYTTTGAQGPRATCKIFGFPIDQSEDTASIVQLNAKPCLAPNAPGWYVAT